jgi:hypothetical protein
MSARRNPRRWALRPRLAVVVGPVDSCGDPEPKLDAFVARALASSGEYRLLGSGVPAKPAGSDGPTKGNVPTEVP